MLSPETVNSLQWRHKEHDSVSNHQPHNCLLNGLFRHGSKKTSKLHATGLCEVNSPVTGEFPAQRASNAENVSVWWRHHMFNLAIVEVFTNSIPYTDGLVQDCSFTWSFMVTIYLSWSVQLWSRSVLCIPGTMRIIYDNNCSTLSFFCTVWCRRLFWEYGSNYFNP